MKYKRLIPEKGKHYVTANCVMIAHDDQLFVYWSGMRDDTKNPHRLSQISGVEISYKAAIKFKILMGCK